MSYKLNLIGSLRIAFINPHPELLSMTKKDWEDITQEVFSKVFKKSAVKRTKFSGLQRNIEFLKR